MHEMALTFLNCWVVAASGPWGISMKGKVEISGIVSRGERVMWGEGRLSPSHRRKAASNFVPFITAGKLKAGDCQEKDVAILRDTGANHNTPQKSVGVEQ